MRSIRLRRCSRLLIAALVVCFTATMPARGSSRRNSAIVQVVRQTNPSVVDIRSEKTVLYESATNLRPFEHGRRINGMGTGVIIDERGYIVTNYHVIEGVQMINVTLSNGEKHPNASVIARDRDNDLAIIKINSRHPLPVLPMGTSNDLMLGETVIAVGNAFGYEHTVTTGIISALGRDVEVNESQSYKDLIQTDASINPGNSGGPLLNIDGDWIGVNVAIRAGAQGISFAIPIDKVRRHVLDLMNTRNVSRTWHGIQLREATRSDASRRTATVEALEPSSPGAKAGLSVGDVLVEVAGRHIGGPLDLERALLDKMAGQDVPVRVRRHGEERVFSLSLEPMRGKTSGTYPLAWQTLGLRLEPVGSSTVRGYSRRYRGGLRVTDVRHGGPAARQGVRRGDILVGLHIWEVINLQNLTYVLTKADTESFDRIKYFLLRGGEERVGYFAIGHG